jgi:hypothetical protein
MLENELASSHQNRERSLFDVLRGRIYMGFGILLAAETGLKMEVVCLC